jgi:hypothetical protein
MLTPLSPSLRPLTHDDPCEGPEQDTAVLHRHTRDDSVRTRHNATDRPFLAHGLTFLDASLPRVYESPSQGGKFTNYFLLFPQSEIPEKEEDRKVWLWQQQGIVEIWSVGHRGWHGEACADMSPSLRLLNSDVL